MKEMNLINLVKSYTSVEGEIRENEGVLLDEESKNSTSRWFGHMKKKK